MTDVTFESIDDINIVERADKFKVDAGYTYRIGLPLTKDGHLQVATVDYFTMGEGQKFTSWLASDDESLNEAALKVGADRKTRWVTIFLVYRTDKQGKIASPLTWELKPAVLSKTKVLTLKSFQEEGDLSEIDLKITTDNAEYQNHTYIPLRTCIWRAEVGSEVATNAGLTESIKDEVLARAKEISGTLLETVATLRSDSAIRDILSNATGGVKSIDARIEAEFETLDESDI